MDEVIEERLDTRSWLTSLEEALDDGEGDLAEADDGFEL